jgi:hypothetical protein
LWRLRRPATGTHRGGDVAKTMYTELIKLHCSGGFETYFLDPRELERQSETILR